MDMESTEHSTDMWSMVIEDTSSSHTDAGLRWWMLLYPGEALGVSDRARLPNTDLNISDDLLK